MDIIAENTVSNFTKNNLTGDANFVLASSMRLNHSENLIAAVRIK